MEATNLLIIMDDEHNKKMLGCYGHPVVKTPNLDRLAARGTRFTNAYTNSPICTPARAVFATGRHVYQTGYWDNAIAYEGKIPAWGHVLQAHGHPVVSIGKLHYASEEANTGFDRQVIPMHIEGGVGDLHGLLREPLPVRHQSKDMAIRIGPGDTSYTGYDRQIADEACQWLQTEGAQPRDKPWTLFTSFISPHSPLVAPQAYYDMYPPESIELPKKRPEGFDHPWWDALNKCYIFDQSFRDDHQRRIAIASYYALCSYIDAQIGRVLDTLAATGLEHHTRVIFLSDHGDNMGARGLWGKSNMYEESAGIPMIAAGPGIGEGKQCDAPVSHVDFWPTILEAMGVPAESRAAVDHPGRSLFKAMRESEAEARDQVVLSEYHAAGSISACYMIRKGDWKYIHYTGFRPELFNLREDPEELTDRAADPACAGVLAALEQELRQRLDPEATDRRAKAAQAELIEKHGGYDAIERRGGGSYTPVPGEEVQLIRG
jgi:choline-sulfatase